MSDAPALDLTDARALLQRAEKSMRELAAAAMAGPWEVPESIHGDPFIVQKGRGFLTGGLIARASGEDYGKGNSEHIASWDPIVALAVADVLHQAAMDLWAHGPLCICTTGCDACDDNLWEPHVRNALALARAYLGETA